MDLFTRKKTCSRKQLTDKELMEAKDKLFVALDVEGGDEALRLVTTLSGYTRRFKVGSQLFTAAGPDVVRKIVAAGAQVFLDLKFHDIPTTVAAAAAEATRLGVFMFNLHAAGGREMIVRAVESASEAAMKSGQEPPLVLGVTVLTSTDSRTLQETGIARSVEEQVLGLARLSAEAGLNGVVASPREARLIRASIDQPGFVIVTPGIRPTEASKDDQKRVMTPLEAIRAGADYLVVGRPITAASDPISAVQQIISEIEGSLA